MNTPKYDADTVSAQANLILATKAVSDLAIQLAERDGEEVSRPLSKDQFAAALKVLFDERGHLLGLLKEWGKMSPARDGQE